MSAALLIALAVLVGVLALLQVTGVRALASWGVQPSRAVLAIRTANYVLVVAALVWALAVWAGR